MKIGDEVYVHGYVDEIREDTVIIRNEGGYFGTSKNEVTTDTELDWGKSEYIFSADKFTAVMYGNEIHIVRHDDPRVRVIIERNWGSDCPWK